MVIIFNLYQLTASAKETTTYITSEEGAKIGVEIPKIESLAVKTVGKNKSTDINSTYQLTKKQRSRYGNIIYFNSSFTQWT